MSHSRVGTNVYRERARDWDLLLLDAARIRAGERLLFVSSGDGWIVEEGWRRTLKGYACGLETSPALVARATALRGVPGKLEFATWDGNGLPRSTHSFDRVMSTRALERCSAVAVLLEGMHRALRPGGEVYLLEFEQPAGGARVAPLSAALQLAGFHETHEVLRHGSADASGSGTAVIIRARRMVPPVLPRAVEPAA